MEWYKFDPVDTLFFRGAEPMNLGENHTTSHVFPPPAQTLSGALRTAVLMQRSIPIENYAKGKAPDQVYDAIGHPGKPAPFHLIGPLFLKNEALYIPAPYSWFMEKHTGNGKVQVIKARATKSRLLRSGDPEFTWAKGTKGEVVSLGGMWITTQDLATATTSISVLSGEDFFTAEPRTGIALERNRRVREGHLYSFNHARLQKNTSLIFGTDRHLPLEKRGTLKIGAEQRFGWYERVDEKINLPDGPGELYLSLSVLDGNRETNQTIFATGKILYLGGWDLHTGFHKPMKGFFPAGTVCTQKINTNFIALKEE